MATGVTWPSFQAHDLSSGHVQISLWEVGGEFCYIQLTNAFSKYSVTFISVCPNFATTVIRPLGMC